MFTVFVRVLMFNYISFTPISTKFLCAIKNHFNRVANTLPPFDFIEMLKKMKIGLQGRASPQKENF